MRTFTVGDKVQWMAVYTTGTSARFSTRYGKIIELSPKGAVAHIKMAGGRKKWIEVDQLRHQNERSELTDQFLRLSNIELSHG